MKSIKTYFSGSIILVIVLLAVGCKKTETETLTDRLPSPVGKDWSAFASARDFDPPGTVYRVDPDGVISKVGDLKISPEKGHEETLRVTKKTKVNLGGIFETLGVVNEALPAELKAKLNRTVETELGSVSGVREYLVDDSGMYPKLTELFKRVEYMQDNEYFVIRETIATRKISFSFKTNWMTEVGAKADIKKLINANANADWNSDNSVSLIKTFDSPLRIWYKAEKVKPKDTLGMGPAGGLRFERDKEAKPGELELNLKMPEKP